MGQHGFEDAVADGAHLFENGGRGRKKMKPVGAAVVRIGPAFDEVRGLQFIDNAGDADWLHVHLGGEIDLAQALGAGNPGQHGPLGTRHPDRPGALVDDSAQDSGGVREKEPDLEVVG